MLVYALEKLLRLIFFAASCRGGAQTGTDYMTRYKLFIYNIGRSTCLHLHISLYRMRVWVRVLLFLKRITNCVDSEQIVLDQCRVHTL